MWGPPKNIKDVDENNKFSLSNIGHKTGHFSEKVSRFVTTHKFSVIRKNLSFLTTLNIGWVNQSISSIWQDHVK